MSSWLGRLSNGWRSYWFAPQSAVELSLIRLTFFGYLYYRYSWPTADYKLLSEKSGLFKPVSFFTLGLEVPSYDALLTIYAVFSISLLFTCIGLFTRTSAACAFLTGLFIWGLRQNFGKYTGGGVDGVVIAMSVYAFARSGDYLSIDHWLKKAAYNPRKLKSAASNLLRSPPPPSGEYRWPVRFGWLVFFCFYTTAGVSKLTTTGWDWALSDNLKYLLIRHHYSHFPPTTLGLWVAQYPWLYKGLGLSTLFAESLCLLGLLHPWARALFAISLLSMQFGIYLTLGVQFMGVFAMGWLLVPWEPLLMLVTRRRKRLVGDRGVSTGQCVSDAA